MNKSDKSTKIPKVNAEGDKLPEDKRKNIKDPINQKTVENSDEGAPEATAEGDKLPENRI